MWSRWLFGIFYRIGFTPWEGHEQSAALKDLIARLPKGKSLDIGCGTGDTTILLAREGWEATGIDFVEKALERARKKAEGTSARFLRADATQLSSFGVGDGFNLITDNGCMHGLDDQQLAAYTREVTQAAAPGAHLLIVAFLPGKRRGPRGIDGPGIQRVFPGWKLLESGPETWKSKAGETLHHYLLQKS